jgi:hypothetical protein
MKLRYLTGLVLAIALMGCINTMSGHDYDIAVKNTGNKDVHEVEVLSSKGFWHLYGVLIPNAAKTYSGPIKYPYRDKFTVKWVASDQQKFSKTLDLTEKFPKKFKGRLVFEIDKDNNLTYATEGYDRKPIEVK